MLSWAGEIKMISDVDFLVLGSGIAGLSFALNVCKYGRVALITKKSDTESNTNHAQGGIASVTSSDDSFDLHIRDTLIAGAGLCHEDAVFILVHEGPQYVRELVELGVKFSMETNAEGKLTYSLGREGGHSKRRILHAADLTGKEIERALIVQAKRQDNIRMFENDFTIDLITAKTADGRIECCGAYVLDTDTEEITTFRAKVVMLATGGCGNVYLHSTNPDIATGDGVAMAFRAGADIGNMEFIQFHPTTLFYPDADSFLISEAVRGEGGILRLKDGSTFMEKYHEMGCLAPRDIVARAIDAELKKSGDEYVYLDITHLEAETIKNRFPNIYKKCLSFGIDITKDWIPIVPAAHYSCGGVVTDINGKTTIDRLYACGEVACTGVHGANRLASNSLLEALVFGHRAAADSLSLLNDNTCSDLPEYNKEPHTEPVDAQLINQLADRVRKAMWRYVGIVRTDERLMKAKNEILDILSQVDEIYARSKLNPELLELRNIAMVGCLIIQSALTRKESRGLNYNTDHPDTDDILWKKDTILNISSQKCI